MSKSLSPNAMVSRPASSKEAAITGKQSSLPDNQESLSQKNEPIIVNVEKLSKMIIDLIINAKERPISSSLETQFSITEEPAASTFKETAEAIFNYSYEIDEEESIRKTELDSVNCEGVESDEGYQTPPTILNDIIQVFIILVLSWS